MGQSSGRSSRGDSGQRRKGDHSPARVLQAQLRSPGTMGALHPESLLCPEDMQFLKTGNLFLGEQHKERI